MLRCCISEQCTCPECTPLIAHSLAPHHHRARLTLVWNANASTRGHNDLCEQALATQISTELHTMLVVARNTPPRSDLPHLERYSHIKVKPLAHHPPLHHFARQEVHMPLGEGVIHLL